MRTPDQCIAKADDLEREARSSKSPDRRQAFLDLASHWRRLAQGHAARPANDEPGGWALRRSRLN